MALPNAFRYVPVAERTFANVEHPMCEGGATVVAFQVHEDTPTFYRVTKRITGAAHCATTGEWVPVLAWNAELERAFRDLASEAPRDPASRRYKRRFWIVVGVTALLLAGLAVASWVIIRSELAPNAYQLSQERIAAVAAAPSPGDLVAVTGPEGMAAQQWLVVRAVTDGAVELQAYDATVEGMFEVPELDAARFTGPTRLVPREAFLADGMLGDPEAPAPVTNALPDDDGG